MLLVQKGDKVKASAAEPRAFQLFIASPSDVSDERASVVKAAERIERQRRRYAFKVFRWEDGPPTSGGSAQRQVERFIPEPKDLDLFVMVLWQRYGTLLAEDGISGTHREFRRAVESRKQFGRPEILAYHCTAVTSIRNLDATQLVQLQDLLKEVESQGLLTTFAERGQTFETMVADHIARVLDDWESTGAPSLTSTPPTPQATQATTQVLARIREARERIGTRVARTPLVRSKRMEGDLQCRRILLKLECIQVTGSFKIRGAMNAIMLASAQDKGVVFSTASAGNHGLGVAYSATRCGVTEPPVIYMPRGTPLTKRKAIERYTNNIKLIGDSFEDTKKAAIAESDEEGYRFIHPYNDLDVIAGQGTLGLEIIEDINEQYKGDPPDIVIIPVGGGGLIAGVATVVKSVWPKTRVIGAEAANMPSLATAIDGGYPKQVAGTRTFADGIAVAEIGDVAFPILQSVVDEVWSVTEESMAKAVVRYIEDTRVVAEGAGACALGGLLDRHASDAASISGKSILIVVSGGNLDTIALSKLLQRALVLEKRLAHFSFVADDVPGSLARITKDFADLQVNILDLWHNRMNAYLRVGTTIVDVIVETRDAGHVDSLLDALRARGHQVSIITE